MLKRIFVGTYYFFYIKRKLGNRQRFWLWLGLKWKADLIAVFHILLVGVFAVSAFILGITAIIFEHGSQKLNSLCKLISKKSGLKNRGDMLANQRKNVAKMIRQEIKDKCESLD